MDKSVVQEQQAELERILSGESASEEATPEALRGTQAARR